MADVICKDCGEKKERKEPIDGKGFSGWKCPDPSCPIDEL